MIYMAYYETPTASGVAMLGNPKKRALKISLDREDTRKGSTSGDDPYIKPETVKLAAEKTKEVLKFAAVTLIGAYAAVKTIDTVSKVVLKKTKSADKED